MALHIESRKGTARRCLLFFGYECKKKKILNTDFSDSLRAKK